MRLAKPSLIVVFSFCLTIASGEPESHVLDLGSRLELMVDDYLIDSMIGLELKLHPLIPREIAIVHDQPWEGSGCSKYTVFRDGHIYRMYYKSWQIDVDERGVTLPHGLFCAYAESSDGKTWVKPELGLVEFNGSTNNNIFWAGRGSNNFTPFRDANPDCSPAARYKAVGGKGEGGRLFGFQSPDGLHWSLIQEEPIMTGYAFDTQNLVFWDTVRKEYRAYIRDYDGKVRGIRTATSSDFLHWTRAVWLEYPNCDVEALYNNQIKPYYRAPHIFIGLPARYIDRGWSERMKVLPELEQREYRSLSNTRYGTALTESLFMTSRDGVTFKRWPEAFLRPGPKLKDNWTYGDNYLSWQFVETEADIEGAVRELSIYATEGYFKGTSSRARRYTIRIDGFVSVNAPMSGGEFVTKPFLFKGNRLVMNLSTSAAGGIRIEIQDHLGNPVEGFALDDCPEIFGDSLAYTASWKRGSDIGHLEGVPIRLRFVLRDSDLYSIQFQ
jgi:hypothetical protein